MKHLLTITVCLLCAACQPEPTKRHQVTQGIKEIKQNQRKQREDIIIMESQLREIDSLINLYEKQSRP